MNNIIALTCFMLLFSGCMYRSKPQVYNMSNQVVILDKYKKKGTVKFFDQKDYVYPRPNNDQFIDFGEGVLYRKLVLDLMKFDVPKGEKARVYIEANNGTLYKDIQRVILRFNQFVLAKTKATVDLIIKGNLKNKKFVDLLLKEGDRVYKEYRHINILDVIKKENTDDFETLKYKINVFEIKKNTIKKSNLSFSDAKKYCQHKYNSILPKLYLFEAARREGILNPPRTANKEYISGYLRANVRKNDQLPESRQDMIVFNWTTKVYESYSRERKDDVVNFRDVVFRCMRYAK